MRYALFLISLIIFILFVPHFEKSMQNRPVYAKLGFVPQGKFYKAVLGNFRWFEGEYYTFKSIIYYGGKVKDITYNHGRNVEYYNLYRTIETAIVLNPYNEDAYYFAQGAFVWGVGHVKAVNGLLRYVYKYRPWDFQIPFFLGFNYAYFLHNYKESAKYFKQAADLTHSPLFTNLAARYFYKGGEVKLGISYLEYMIKNTENESVRNIYKIRLKALIEIEKLSKAVSIFKEKYGRIPKNLNELVMKGIIESIPKDPYGGEFYIDKNGTIETTSKLAKGWKNESDRSKKSY